MVPKVAGVRGDVKPGLGSGVGLVVAETSPRTIAHRCAMCLGGSTSRVSLRICCEQSARVKVARDWWVRT